MRVTQRLSLLVLPAILWASADFAAAQIAFGPVADTNYFSPQIWGVPPNDRQINNQEIFNQGIYAVNDAALEPDGNDILKASTGVVGSGNDQFGVAIHISNGENGNDGDDPDNPDAENFEPADPIWTTIGNPSGRLENGNVVRFSMWMRQDPTDTIITAPSIESILKLEFWTEALSGDADFATSVNPTFGDRVFDTDQNGFAPTATFVDINNDGIRDDFNTPSVSLTPTGGWTLVSTEYTVDDSGWGYRPGGGDLIPKTVADIEELRPVMFTGDFASTDLTDGGSLLVDNPMVEVYRTTGDVPGTVPNPAPAPPPASLLVDRDTGDITITNLTSSSSELAGYSIFSGADELIVENWLSIADNYDADSGSGFDPSNVWMVTESTGGVVSEESTTAGSGGILAPGATLELGDAWLQTPFEELFFEYLMADGTTGTGAVRFTGNGGVPYARSDFNIDGVVNESDWEIFYPNSLTDLSELGLAEAYLRGDLDGDNDNDFFDFRIFKEDFIAANGSAAWNALVPEPSSVALLGLGLLGFGLSRRRSSRRGNTKYTVLAILMACVVMAAPAESRAQTAFTVDPNATWQGYMNVFDTPADGGAFRFGSNWTTTDLRASFALGPSQPLTLNPNTNTYDDNLTDDYWVDQTTLLGNKDMEANFYQESFGLNGQLITFDYEVLANTLPAGYSAIGFIKVLDANAGFATVQNEFVDLTVGGASLSLQEDGTASNPLVQAGFTWKGLNVSSSDPVALTNVIISDGTDLNQLALEVDTTTGEVRLQNNTPVETSIDWYQITSPAASALNTAGWDSLDAQDFDSANGGWNEAGGSDANQLAELFLGASGSAINTDFDLSLGNAFSPGSATDLIFQYGVVGGGLVTGLVDYVSTPLNCDFTDDGACNIDDLNLMLAEGPIAGGVAVTPGVNDQFDLDGNNVIDNNDRDLWLATAATENGFGSPYKIGDANLDGSVDVTDFNNWNGNKFTSSLQWDQGDFTGDGSVDVSDFNGWNSNKFQSSDGISAVPEPGTAVITLAGMLCGCWIFRRR